MSEDQLTALLGRLQNDVELQQHFAGAADLDSAIDLARGAGFDISKSDWIKYQARQTLTLTDQELEEAVGGKVITVTNTPGPINDIIPRGQSDYTAPCMWTCVGN